MGQITMAIFPPEYWEDFELLTWDVCKTVWQDDYAQMHGRSGQKQSGVDVYGCSYKSMNQWIGVQCKKKKQVDQTGKILAGGLLTEKQLKDEVKKAKSFWPSLAQFIIATTALRDTYAQELVRRIDLDQRSNNSFGVSIWFWEDYQYQLNLHAELMYRYYEDVLKSRNTYNPDKHILYLLQTAFSGSVSQFARSSERMSYQLLASLPAQSGYTTDGFASYRVVCYAYDCADQTAS